MLGGERGVGLCSGGAALRSFGKERISEISETLIGRERVNMMRWFYQRNEELIGLYHSEGSVPHSDFNGGNNLRTPALQ